MDRGTPHPPPTTTKKKPQRKHLFAAQSSESAADAFTERATAAELTNLHIQGLLEGDCSRVMKAWRRMRRGPEWDTPQGLLEREMEGGEQQSVGGGRRRFITTKIVGGLIGRRRRRRNGGGRRGGRHCDWSGSWFSLGETGLLCKNRADGGFFLFLSYRW